MAVTFHQCRRLVGRPVVMRCRGGRTYCGIIRRVTPEAVFITPFGRGAVPVQSHEKAEVIPADLNGETGSVETVQFFGPNYGFGFGGNAILALALFDILAISLLVW